MISKLTEKQKTLVPVYFKKWLDIGINCNELDEDLAKESVKWIYSFCKHKAPSSYVFLPSPKACQEEAKKITGKNSYQNQLYVNWWVWWVGFYDFILEELFPERKKEFKDFLTYQKHIQNLHIVIPFANTVFISNRPKDIFLNERMVLHNQNGMSMFYRDGYGLYNLNGVTVPKLLVETEAKNLIPQDWLKHNNMEVRREALRKIGVERLCEKLKYVSHDRNEMYELITFKELHNGEYFPYLKMINPSIGTHHIEGVDSSCLTIEQALAWRNGLSSWTEPEILT